MSPATFNYYQELIREIEDFSTEDLQTAVEAGRPVAVRAVFNEYLHVPWGLLTTDNE